MFRLLLSAVLAMALSACAASGSVQTISADRAQVDSARAVTVDVTSRLAGKGDTVDALRNAIVAQLVSKKVFKSVTDMDAARYQLKVDLVEVSEVTQGARLLFGALAGQAGVTANVEIYDRQEGRVLSSLVAKGSSSGGHAFAGTTQEAVDQAAMQIADYLLQNRKL